MSFMDKAVPALNDKLQPPCVLGTADLTSFAYQGAGYDALMERIRDHGGSNPADAEEAAWTYDAGIAAQLHEVAGMDHVAVTRDSNAPGAAETFEAIAAFIDTLLAAGA